MTTEPTKIIGELKQCGWERHFRFPIFMTGCGEEVDADTDELPPGWKFCPFCGAEILPESSE